MKGAAITRLGTNTDACHPGTEAVRTTVRAGTSAGKTAGTTAGTVETTSTAAGGPEDPAKANMETAAEAAAGSRT